MMNAQRMVFIEPPISLEDIYKGLAKTGAVSPPLNLLLLAAVVREQGFEPFVLDCPARGYSYRQAIEELRIIKPKFVGITAMTPHIMQANKLAMTIKDEMPDIIILLGGVHVSAVPQETMRQCTSIDIAVLGEAENSLPELLRAINNKKSLQSIGGLVVRDSNEIVLTGDRIEKIDLDSLPLYAWDLLEGFPISYRSPLFTSQRSPATPILTSRGCPGRCTFCYSGCHKTISAHKSDYVFNMLKYLRDKYGIVEFQIFDDNFTMYKSNLTALLHKIVDEKLDMTWSCNARIDMVNREMLRLMAKAGCWQISYGIESGNQRILDTIGKNITKERVKRAIDLTRAVGIRTVGYFMVGHFDETDETIEETIAFAKTIGLDDFRMSFFTPLPGTISHTIAEKYGEFDRSWEKMTLFAPVFVPWGFTKDKLIKAQKKAIRSFFFRPRVVMSYLKMIKNPIKALKGALALGQYVLTK